MDAQQKGWYKVADDNCPENYGFNAIPLSVSMKRNKVKVSFEGLTSNDSINYSKESGWRYGFVGVTLQWKSIYGKMSCSSKGVLVFEPPKDVILSHLYLVVMGAPKVHTPNPMYNERSDKQWPYRVKFVGTQPLNK